VPDDQTPRSWHFATSLSHDGRPGTKIRAFVNLPVYRGSTMLHVDTADRLHDGSRVYQQADTYGAYGNTTHHALENLIAKIEGGTRCQITSTGISAITTALLAYVKAGDHCLVPDSVYGSTRQFISDLLTKFGVAVEYYDPALDAAGLAPRFRLNTTVLFLESPGSHTFEVQDVPALAALAHAHGAKVLLDNTWGIHHFQPFRHGVDVSIQALTKYPVGHSDVLLGAAIVNDDGEWHRLRNAALAVGQYASPDDCWLCLRGLRTLGVRLQHQYKAALEIAAWLRERPEIGQVLYPALPGAPGHEIWKRDFTGACSLFGIVFAPEWTASAINAFIDALELFGIGSSWGGFESLAIPTYGTITRTAGSGKFGGLGVRIHIGLEDPADLIADLKVGFAALHRSRPQTSQAKNTKSAAD
jgi:cysteine-S-conjugate beta-lyase